MAWSATKYDLERLENTLAYERSKQRIERRYRGKWVAIARGELVAVAATAEECLDEAHLRSPRPNHRFLFQVGVPLPEAFVRDVAVNECTDLEQCRHNAVNKIGFGKLLKKAGGKLEDDYENNRTCVTLGDKTKCWKWQKAGGGKKAEEFDLADKYGIANWAQCIEMTFDKPKTTDKKAKCVLLDTGAIGFFAMLDTPNFLALAPATEHPDDDLSVSGLGGKVKVRAAMVSMEIPQVNFSVKLVGVVTGEDALKQEVEKQKKAEEEKKAGGAKK